MFMIYLMNNFQEQLLHTENHNHGRFHYDRNITLKIDTGADVTVIPKHLYERDKDGDLKPATVTLVGPDQNMMKVLGFFEAVIRKKEETVKETVYVVKGLKTGRPMIVKLDLAVQIQTVEHKEKKYYWRIP